MSLNFDPSSYLAAFKVGQENQQQNRQNNQQLYSDTMGGLESLAKIPEQKKAERYKQLAAYDPSLTDAANAARTEWLATGKLPLASNSPSQQNPQQNSGIPGLSSPPPQMASAGMPDTGWGQTQQPSAMPLTPMPQASPMPQPQQMLTSPIVAAHKEHLARNGKGQPQGMQSLFQRQPVDYGDPTVNKLYAGKSKDQIGQIEKVREFNQRQDENKTRQQEMSDYRNQMLDMKKMNLNQTMGTRDDQFNQKEWDKIMEKHNPDAATPRSSIGISTRLINSADRALETLKDTSHPLTYQDLGNVQQDIASIYQNGSPTDSAMKHNEYSTIYSNLGKTLQSLTGNPQDAVPDGIRKQLIDRLELLKGTSYDVINRDLDTVETGQRRVISNRSDEWKGVRDKWKKPSHQSSGQSQQIGRFQVTVHQ